MECVDLLWHPDISLQVRNQLCKPEYTNTSFLKQTEK